MSRAEGRVEECESDLRNALDARHASHYWREHAHERIANLREARAELKRAQHDYAASALPTLRHTWRSRQSIRLHNTSRNYMTEQTRLTKSGPQLESIVEMVAALNVDYARLETLENEMADWNEDSTVQP